jgi:ParB family transcriptional regulator, chromosome partitioning protein
MNDEIKLIPIKQISIINPRPREKKKFEQIVESIRNLGLKKPIQVNLLWPQEGDEPSYELVCGQGRIEACIALGFKEIPAIIVNVSREERLLRSLVENMARRLPSPLALMNEIERLKDLGYTNAQIGKKLDLPETTVCGYLNLKKAGEERLLDAAISGRVPLSVAAEIARAETPEMQRELLKAYETKQLNYASIRVVKRLMDQRRFIGKNRESNPGVRKPRTSADSLVNAFKRESQRQRLLVKKARVCEARLLFIITAFDKLLANGHFLALLRAEKLDKFPTTLFEKLDNKPKLAA